MKTPLIIASTIILALSWVGSSQAYESGTNKVFDVASGGTLYIDSDSGSIDVESHSRNQVEVKVLKRGNNADDFKVSFEQKGDDVVVEGDKDSSWGWGNYNLNVRFVVKVPESYNLDLKTGGGSIDIENINGEVEVSTSGGSIKLGEITGDVMAKTSGGSIRIEDIAGNVNARTSGGSIKAKLSKQITQDCKLSTSGGSVTAYLAPEMEVELDARTSGGRVSSDFDVDGEVKRRSIKGNINGGGPLLTLKTSGGSVSVKQL